MPPRDAPTALPVRPRGPKPRGRHWSWRCWPSSWRLRSPSTFRGRPLASRETRRPTTASPTASPATATWRSNGRTSFGCGRNSRRRRGFSQARQQAPRGAAQRLSLLRRRPRLPIPRQTGSISANPTSIRCSPHPSFGSSAPAASSCFTACCSRCALPPATAFSSPAARGRRPPRRSPRCSSSRRSRRCTSSG